MTSDKRGAIRRAAIIVDPPVGDRSCIELLDQPALDFLEGLALLFRVAWLELGLATIPNTSPFCLRVRMEWLGCSALIYMPSGTRPIGATTIGSARGCAAA
jgi:hypothetical protein